MVIQTPAATQQLAQPQVQQGAQQISSQTNQKDTNQNSVQQQPINPNALPQQGTSIFKKWWFWLLIGIAVVGGVSLIFLM